MADIDGGSLSFKSELDNEQLNAAIEETIRRVQGFSTAVVESGDTMEHTNQGMIANARATLGQIGDLCEQQEQALGQLGKEYDRLGKEMNRALLSGRDDEYNALREKRNAIKGEIAVRKQLMKELREQSDVLEEEVTKLEESAKAAEKTAEKHTMLRTQIRDLKEEMAAMVADGIDEQSAAYKEMENKLGRLMDIQGDIQSQGRILANDQAQFQGVISGLNGIVGGFTAAQGAVALFAGENENLQKIMLKVQSLMSIIMGLQQMSEMLNKDSAFRLVTLNKLKEKWNNLLAVGRGKQVASTAATVADTTATVASTAAEVANTTATQANTTAQGKNTVAQGANTVATGTQTATAIAGTTANIGLAGAFRMVGAAIKSIPVFGWILAGISSLIALVSHFVGKANEAKKAQEEWHKSIAENAYKPIASIEELSVKWNALGDDLEAKKKFIEANKKAFDELGVSINGVTDAENLLVANKQNFIDAQIEKAKAMILVQQAQEEVKNIAEMQLKYDAMPDKKSFYVQAGGQYGSSGSYVEGENTEKTELGEEIEKRKIALQQKFTDAAAEEKKSWKKLEEAGIDAAGTYEAGTLGAIENLIQEKQAMLKKVGSNAEYEKILAEIAELQKQADAITGKKSGDGSAGGAPEDPFLEKLNKRKAEYQRFNKWINSDDAILVQSANKEFDGLLKEGSTYIEYLKNQRDQILSVDVANRTKAQNKQLRQLNDAIAEETKQTVLDEFNSELNEQLTNAKTTLEMLKIIEQKRKELSGDGTEVDNAKGEVLDDAEKNAKEHLAKETEALLAEYATYAEKKRRIDEQYERDYELLMKRRAEATNDEERSEIDAAIANRKNRRDNDVNGIGGVDYNAMLLEYGTFEQRKQSIIDEFDQKRRIAQENGNAEMLERLNDAQAKAISSLATKELTNSDIWGQLFNNLDEMTASEIETLVDEIENQFENLSVSFNPADLAEIRNQLNAAKDVLIQDNPFKQMGQALISVFEGASDDSKESADDVKKNWTKLGKATEQSFAFITDAINQCEPLKEVLGDIGATALSSLQATVMAAISVAAAVKTAEKSSVVLAIIQAALVAVQVIFSLFQLKDKEIEKHIQKHQVAVNNLKNEYTQLSWEINKALGGDFYNLQKKSIENLENQKKQIQEMQRLEEEKKKTDDEKVRDYIEQQKDIDRQIQDAYDEIAEDILQTTGKDFASELADSLVNAFAKGEDAAKAFEQTVNDVLKNAIVNQLKKEFLDKQLQGALNDLKDAMGTWVGDDFVFDGLTDEEIASFKDKVQNASGNFQQAMDIYKDIFKDLNADDSANSLTGAVKGVSEETASILAGQMNAIRINQLESTEVLRQSLMTLNTIAQNTAYNRYLSRIETIITILESNSTRDTLRSRGLS